jgi:hypothetical protein
MTYERWLACIVVVGSTCAACSTSNPSAASGDHLVADAGDSSNTDAPPAPDAVDREGGWSGDASSDVCADRRQAYAHGSEDAGLMTSVELEVCVVDGSAVQADRTGPALCSEDSREAPCPTADCVHECFNNADCGSGESCLCAVAARVEGGETGPYVPVYSWQSQCVVSECESSADCDGFACGFSREKCGSPAPGFYCRTADDACRSDEDCDASFCRYFAERGHWACSHLQFCD